MTKPKSTTQAAFNEAYRPFIALESPSDRTELLIGVDRLVCAATEHIQRLATMRNIFSTLLDMSTAVAAAQSAPTLSPSAVKKVEKG